jgi:hypothetical protein
MVGRPTARLQARLNRGRLTCAKIGVNARLPRGQIEETIEPVRRDQKPDLGSQLEDLRIHVLGCERWAQFDDRLDLALTSSQTRRAR